MIIIYLYQGLDVSIRKGGVDTDSTDLCKSLNPDLIGKLALVEQNKRRKTKKLYFL